MEGAKDENNIIITEKEAKSLNEKEIEKNNIEILPINSNKSKIELKENKEIDDNNKNDKMNIEEEKVLKNITNENEIEETKKEKQNQLDIKKEIYRSRLTSLKESSCRNVNNYKIIKDHIGEGTFGMVFKAEYVGILLLKKEIKFLSK